MKILSKNSKKSLPSGFRLYDNTYPSVTSIIHYGMAEPAALRYWRESHPDWKEIMEYRANVGTLAHHKIAEYFAERFGLPKPDPLEMECTDKMDIEAGASMSYFDDFVNKYDLEPEAVETEIFHRIMKYKGTLDFRGKIRYKGVCRNVILDWKTSSDIWESHEMQTVAYKQALLTDFNYKDNIDACVVVIVNPIKGLKIGRVANERLAWDQYWNCFDSYQRTFRTTEELMTKEEAGYK